MDKMKYTAIGLFSNPCVILACLCTLWYSTSTGISDSLHFSSFTFTDFIFVETVILNAFLPIGLITGALICDGKIKVNIDREKMGAILAFASSAFTIMRFLFSSVWSIYPLYICVSAISYIAGYGVFSLLFFHVIRKTDARNRAFFYGAAIGISYIIRIPVDIYTASSMFGSASVIIFAAYAALSMLGASAYILCSKNAAGFFIPDTQKERTDKTAPILSIVKTAIACTFAVGILYSLFNMFTILNMELEQFMPLFRVVQAVSAMLSGYLCMKLGKHIPIIFCMTLFGLGIFAHWFSYSGVLAFLFISMTVTALFFFAIPARIIFVDVSDNCGLPAVICVMGLASYHLFQLIGLFIFRFVKAFDTSVSFILYIAIFIMCVPLITVLFSQLRALHVNQAKEEIGRTSLDELIQKFNFTKRETEIFVMLLQGLSTNEMATGLFVSENTVRWHMSNIIKKTGFENRSQLIEMYRSIQLSCGDYEG